MKQEKSDDVVKQDALTIHHVPLRPCGKYLSKNTQNLSLLMVHPEAEAHKQLFADCRCRR